MVVVGLCFTFLHCVVPGRPVLVQIGKGDNWQLPYCPKMDLLVIGPIIHPTLDLQPGRFPDVFFKF